MASWQNRAHAHECQHRRTNSNGQPSAASSGNRRSGAQPRTAAVARERKPLLAVLGVRCPGSRAGGLGGRDDGHRALRRHVVVVLHVRPVDHVPPGAQGAPRVSQSSRTIELCVTSLCTLSHAPNLGPWWATRWDRLAERARRQHTTSTSCALVAPAKACVQQ